MTPLRIRMIEDMTLAGLVPGTQAVYIQAVRHLFRSRFSSNAFPITQTSAYITEKRGWLPRFGGSHQWSGSAQVECGEHGGTLRLTFMVAVYEVQAAATDVVAASDQTALACLSLLACCGGA